MICIPSSGCFALHPDSAARCGSFSPFSSSVVVGALALQAGHDPDIEGALIIARGEEPQPSAGIVEAIEDKQG